MAEVTGIGLTSSTSPHSIRPVSSTSRTQPGLLSINTWVGAISTLDWAEVVEPLVENFRDKESDEQPVTWERVEPIQIESVQDSSSKTHCGDTTKGLDPVVALCEEEKDDIAKYGDCEEKKTEHVSYDSKQLVKARDENLVIPIYMGIKNTRRDLK